MHNFKTLYSKDPATKKMTAQREFAAPLNKVWAAWTEKDLLDQWWAPKPWKTQTKSLSFCAGGSWLYCMMGPDGSKHWSGQDYKLIIPGERISSLNYFCDENAVLNRNFPVSDWEYEFKTTAKGTRVTIGITYQHLEDLQKMTDMGFEAGFEMAHHNLDALFLK